MTQVATEASPCAQPQNTGFSHDLTCFKAARCTRLCKIFGLNRTKMFHVKHFGTICLEQYEKVQQLRTFVRQTWRMTFAGKSASFRRYLRVNAPARSWHVRHRHGNGSRPSPPGIS
jgi:hypothetical protein